MAPAPLVSVVTPVYNGERYLDECLESVLRQTLPDWELVIVDNVSTDATAEIAERFAARDRRIRVVRLERFLDALDNHNRAMLEMHTGATYCKVLHADDWLYPECLERMVDVAEQHPSVGVVSSFRLLGDRVDQVSPMPYSQTCMPGRELIRWELFGPQGSAWATGSPSTLLLRADLVRQQAEFYDRTVWHSDTEAAYRLLMQSDFGFVSQMLTFTRRHAGNLMSFSQRVWSVMPRDGRLLLRYGPRVLEPDEYQRALEAWLWRYGSWLARQALKPARRGQQEFHDFHQREIDYLLAEAGADRRTRLILNGYRRLLRPARVREAAAAAGPQLAR